MDKIEWTPDEPGGDAMTVALDPDARGRDRVYLFGEREVLAINMAIAAARPLLVLGEPGTGKSQLARAAAKKLGRTLHRTAVSAATDPEGLLYELDLVERLAKAQLAQALYGGAAVETNGETPASRREKIEDELALSKFLRPGVLWKGFDPVSAKIPDAKTALEAGAVVLIDEIDKADPSVPNGLLDALGRGAFDVPGPREIKCEGTHPLVVVTSNDERAMPAAFLRRCLVLRLALPTERTAFVQLMRVRGRAHLGEDNIVGDGILDRAAQILWEDRDTARKRRVSVPGQAEFIDLVWSLAKLGEDDESRAALLNALSHFAFDKHGTRAVSPRRAPAATPDGEQWPG